eukprot:3314573-Rhodomonas_salina.1
MARAASASRERDAPSLRTAASRPATWLYRSPSCATAFDACPNTPRGHACARVRSRDWVRSRYPVWSRYWSRGCAARRHTVYLAELLHEVDALLLLLGRRRAALLRRCARRQQCQNGCRRRQEGLAQRAQTAAPIAAETKQT